MQRRAILIAAIVVLALVSGYAMIAMNRNGGSSEEPTTQSAVAQTSPGGGDRQAERKSEADRKPAEEERKADSKPGIETAPKPKSADNPQVPKRDDARRSGQDQGRPQVSQEFAGKMHLMRMAFLIGALERSDKDALTPAQAKQVLVILRPLRSKPKLSNEESQQIAARLDRVFTKEQREAMANMTANSRGAQRPDGERQGPPPGMTAGRPPRDGSASGEDGVRRERPRPDGPEGRTGETRTVRRFDAEEMKDFNPFYTGGSEDDQLSRMQARRVDELFTALENRAK